MCGQGTSLGGDFPADSVKEDLGAREQQVPGSKGAQSCVCLRNRSKICVARGREQMGKEYGMRWARPAGSDHTAGRARSGLCTDSSAVGGHWMASAGEWHI